MSTITPLKVGAYRALHSSELSQTAQALIVQSHCKAVLIQPSVDLSKHPNLKGYATGVNDALNKAKDNSNLYLNTILPGMVNSVTEMGQFFSLQTAILNAFTPSASAADTLKKLKIAQERVTTHQSNATTTLGKLQTLRRDLSTDASNFARVANDMHTAVSGNNGALADLNKSVAAIDKNISGSIAGIVLGGLAVIGGAFVFLIGSVGSFVTAGTSAPVAVLGVGIVAAGVGALAGSSVALSNLLQSKGDLIRLQTGLREEIKLAATLNSTYQGLADSAAAAVQATQDMANAWNLLGQGLDGLIKNLDSAASMHTDPGMLAFFGDPAADDIKAIRSDLDVIKLQLAGVKVAEVKGQRVSSLIVQELGRAA